MNQFFWPLLVLAGIIIFSVLRFRTLTAALETAETFAVTAVQGNIPQDEKWDRENVRHTVDRYINLTLAAQKKEPAALVVWPETALPYHPAESDFTQYIADTLLQKSDIYLLAGAPHRQSDDRGLAFTYYNRAFLFAPDGSIAGSYDKQHLVPFGEYIPFRRFLPAISPVVETMADFTPGDSSSPIPCQNIKIGVLICFESIFPELAREHVEHDASLLVNITNDAWFGKSSAPWQHLAMAVFRSVENRRSMVRSANTGISALIDPAGRIGLISPLFEEYYLSGQVPILTEKAFYTRAGHFFAPACLLLAAAVIIFTRPQSTESKRRHS